MTCAHTLRVRVLLNLVMIAVRFCALRHERWHDLDFKRELLSIDGCAAAFYSDHAKCPRFPVQSCEKHALKRIFAQRAYAPLAEVNAEVLIRLRI